MSPREVPRKLQQRTGEDLLTYNRIRALSLFGDLPPRMEGRLRGQGGQGAVVVRRYRKGEVVCRQHEPGWTAFYLLKAEDLLALRKVHQSMANLADAKLAARAPDKLALPAKERRKLAEKLEQTGGDTELADLLFTSAGRPEAGEIDALLEEQERLERGDRADAELALSHPALTTLSPAAKRRRAEELAARGPEHAARDPHLAALLIASAVAAEQRVRAVVSVARPAHEAPRPEGALQGLLGRLRRRPASAPEAPLHAAHEQEVATLGEGELFGELSCLYHTPRSATVRAVRDFHAIELLGNVLEMLLASEAFRRDLDEIYRKRTLRDQLRATPLFAGAPDDAVALLQSRAELLTLKPGETLFEEGDAPDGVYLVRSGTVKLFHRGAEDRPSGHRSRGETFGERESARATPREITCAGYEHPRDPSRPGRRQPPAARIELVRLDMALLDEVGPRIPAFQEALARAALDDEPAREATALGTSRFDDLGLVQGRSLLLVDLERCTRCDDCVRACADVQADGFPRLALEGPRFGKYLVPASCRKCADATCLVGCPVGSIHRGAAGQIVIESWCIGCGLCAEQCPYQAIDMRALPAPPRLLKPVDAAEPSAPPIDDPERAATCDQCASIAGGPRCVAACAHDAALRVDARDFFARPRLG